MRLVATRRIEPGAILARDVTVGSSGRALLRAGVPLSARYRQALLDNGFNAVYVQDELSEGIEVTPALSEQTRVDAAESLTRAFATVPAASQARQGLQAAAIIELENIANLIASEISEHGESVIALSDLAAADSYTLQHCIDVCAVGLMIAKRLFEEKGRVDYRGNRVHDKLEHWLAKLGVGLMLHDVGKVAIPSEILNKPGRLDDEEMAVVRSHPLAGVELLSSDAVSPLVKAVVRSHHERWDGGGYPNGLSGTDIPHFARIAAVADVFDAVTSERPYHPAAPQHVGHSVINRNGGTQFDVEVVEYFNKVVAPYPPGDEIVLADGRTAVVVYCPHPDLGRPLVRVGYAADGTRVEPEEIDLLEHGELFPVSGVPVAA